MTRLLFSVLEISWALRHEKQPGEELGGATPTGQGSLDFSRHGMWQYVTLDQVSKNPKGILRVLTRSMLVRL